MGRAVWIAAVFVFGLVLLTGCDRTEVPAAVATDALTPVAAKANVVRIPRDSPQLREIRVVPVSEMSVPSDELVAPARVAINPNRISRVLPPLGGRIEKVLVKFGDHVEQGQALITMDSADADAAVSAFLQAQSTEQQARVALDKADADLRRASDLYEHKAIAEKDLLQAQSDRAGAKAGYEIARTVREQTARKLQLLDLKPNELHQLVQVRAPITGSVLEVNVAPGEYRAAISFHTDSTAPLLSIADLSTVWMSADVPESFVRMIRVGEPVSISLVAFPDEVLTGRVARIGDVLDAQTRTLKVHVELANPTGRLRPEMFGTIRYSGSPRTALVIPSAAVVQEYGRSVVFLERGPGVFERQPVTTGVRLGDRVAVFSGVERGDRVIGDGAVLLKGQ